VSHTTILIICADLARMRCCDDDGPMVDDESASCSDLQDWSAEFEALTGRVSSLFVHPNSRAHSRQYQRSFQDRLRTGRGAVTIMTSVIW